MRSLHALSLALSLLAGCSKSPPALLGPKPLATLTTPIKAEVVAWTHPAIEMKSGGGRGAVGAPQLGSAGSTVLRVHREPEIELVLDGSDWSADATRVELSADAAGERIAVGVDGKVWWLVYLGHARRAFKAPDPVVYAGAAFDWSKVPSFASAAVGLAEKARCKRADGSGCAPADRAVAALASEAMEPRDASSVAFLLGTVDWLGADWEKSLASLPADRKKDVVRGLIPALRDHDAAATRLARAMAVAVPADPEAADALVQRIPDLAARDLDERSAQLQATDALNALMPIRARPAAQLGCSVLAHFAPPGAKKLPDFTPESRELALVALKAVDADKLECSAAKLFRKLDDAEP